MLNLWMFGCKIYDNWRNLIFCTSVGLLLLRKLQPGGLSEKEEENKLKFYATKVKNLKSS